MSCFGYRASRPSTPHLPAPLSTRRLPRRRRLPRNRTFNSSHPSSEDPVAPQSPHTTPVEDLGATKRRLVIIRRQSDAAPVNLVAGFKSRTGWQPLSSSRENQDSLALLLPMADPLHHLSMFAVFDGHGRAGHRVSAFAAEHLASNFASILSADKTVPPEAALHRACLRTNRSIVNHPTLDVSMTGTTAAVAVIHHRTVICANIGDSRIIIGTVKNGTVEPVALTTDHVPEHPAERKRIEDSGGRVETWAPSGLDTGPPRVWLKEKRLPGLAMSRVMGDSILKGIITAEPDMTTHKLVEEDRFIVIATDGIWGQMSNEQVTRFVVDHGNEPSQRVAEALVKHAASLWFEAGGETIDDISVILVRLNW